LGSFFSPHKVGGEEKKFAKANRRQTELARCLGVVFSRKFINKAKANEIDG